MTLRIETSTDRWARMIRTTGVVGLITIAVLFAPISWDAASFGSTDLDLSVASYAFDSGNIAFANVWLAMASFAVACGWLSSCRRESLVLGSGGGRSQAGWGWGSRGSSGPRRSGFCRTPPSGSG